jgi:hypothetical protein
MIEHQADHKWKMKVLRFEFCIKVGDICLFNLLKCFHQSLEELIVTRNFYYTFAYISDNAFDLGEEFAKIHYDELYVNEN